jgi:magnesium transporter
MSEPQEQGEKKEKILNSINVIDYDEEKFEEKEIKDIKECFKYKDTPTVSWINIEGINQVEAIKQLDEHYGLHPLVVEDISNPGQRPKIEDFGDYMYLVLRMLSYKDNKILSEQVSIIFGKNFVISIQEGEWRDVFDPVRDKIRNNKGIIRKMGADYLVYRLINAVVDNYFTILEELGEKIEVYGDEIIKDPAKKFLDEVHKLKKEMITLRKSVWPLREAIDSLERESSSLIKKTTKIYLRELYYHTVQVIDTVETYRDMLSEISDIYLSSISNKTNATMKVLTVITTIFMPLSFLAGMYGMNFEFMPYLHDRIGFLLMLSLMLIVVGTMLFIFRKKKWV